jgi:hypothetical protein
MRSLPPVTAAAACAATRAGFSAYLDGAITGVEMAAISTHLDSCAGCATEFAAWRDVQRSLAELGPAPAPAHLHADVQRAIARERERGTNLAPLQRGLHHLQQAWAVTIAPVMLRATVGLVITASVLGALVGLFAAPLAAVQANDDRMAHLVGPRYLYSEVPPQPIETRHDTPILVDAKVDERGLVYDFTILQGPSGQSTDTAIANNLLGSVFQPATLFGVPVRGHVVLTYMGVSVRG